MQHPHMHIIIDTQMTASNRPPTDAATIIISKRVASNAKHHY